MTMGSTARSAGTSVTAELADQGPLRKADLLDLIAAQSSADAAHVQSRYGLKRPLPTYNAFSPSGLNR